MSTADVGAVLPSPVVRKRLVRPATVIAGLAAAVIFALLAEYVLSAGYVRKDIQQLQAGDVWRSGGWLSQVVLRVVNALPATDLQQAVLALLAAVASGLAFGAIYDRLRANGWFVLGAFALLLALGAHAGTLYTLTASSRAIPLYIAFALLIPAIRQVEDVGDVQSAIGMGLLLPLLLLASPLTTPLVLPLALVVALANPDARRDPRAFVAMLLVALLPALIVALGILGFLAQSGFDLADALLPYANAYSTIKLGDWQGSLIGLVAFAPMLVVPLAYCVWPGVGDRHVGSALAVVLLPLWLVAARVFLNTPMTPIVPALALMACFVSWLAVVRLPLPLRAVALVALLLGAALSWTLTGLWDDPAWKAALLHDFPTGNLTLRPGV